MGSGVLHDSAAVIFVLCGVAQNDKIRDEKDNPISVQSDCDEQKERKREWIL